MVDLLTNLSKLAVAVLAFFGFKDIASKIYINFLNKKQNLQISGSRNKAISGNTVTINNFYRPYIKKPEDVFSSSTVQDDRPIIRDYIKEALTLLSDVKPSFSVTTPQVMSIVNFFQSVFDADKNNGRNSSTLVKGACYALLSEGDNPEWIEHCSGSLRELFHAWGASSGMISSAFNKVKKSTSASFPTMTSNRDEYIKMENYYRYFSSKCHHDQVGTLKALRTLHGNEGLKNGSPELFKQTVAMFFDDMSNFVRLT
ncbi:MAG: hypothetical protein PHS79_02155 [Patescibacteria group bacterium]|nr:hypothetical protein [Patescibacteria group bacterium]